MKRDYFAYILALVSIITSLFVSYYFYDKSLKYRELHYMTDIFPQSIFTAQKDSTTPIKISKNDGSPLTSSVYLANHEIWNNGTQPILNTDVLTPITVSFTDKDSSILAVSIAKSSRSVTDCNVCLDKKTNKSFTVSFKVLEPQDGCILKIFYTGSQYPPLKIDGEVIGLKSIILHKDTIDELLNRPNYWRHISDHFPEAILFLAFSLFLYLYMRTRNLIRKVFWLRTITYWVVVLDLVIAIIFFNERREYVIDTHIPKPCTEKWIPQNEMHPNLNISLPEKPRDKTTQHP
jgi:hypothetical protein